MADITGESKYVITIALASIQNVQGYTDSIRNSLNDAAYRLDQTKMAETQFTYMQCTSLVDRRRPVRVRLQDVDVTTTEDMRTHQFEAPDALSEDNPQCSRHGMPEMENIETSTDLQKFVVRVMKELNYKGRAFHPNMRAKIQKDCWKWFNAGTLRDNDGKLVTNKREVWPLIYAKQFISTLPKLALEMVRVHLVFKKAGIQIQWFLPGQNNMCRFLKTILAFNRRITKDMFEVDPLMKETFLKEDIIRYKRVAALVPNDAPLVMVAPAFVSTPNGTDLLSNHLPITKYDSWHSIKAHRYNAYIDSCWIDAPTVVVSLMSCK